VDVLYARERPDGVHRGVFSLSPSELATYVDDDLYILDARAFSTAGSGSTSGTPVLECGTFGGDPLCVWADDSTLVVVQYTDESGTPQSLASTVPAFVRAMTET
jgi:hypothetical protein